MSALRARRRVRGFTLMEVLAALVLMSLLMLAVWSGIRTAMHSVRYGQQFTARTDAVRATQDFIRREMAQAIRMPWAVDERHKPVVFSGSADEVRYVAPLPGYLGRLGPQLQTLRLVRDDPADGYRLEVSFARLPPDGSAPQPIGKPQVLLSGIRQASFSFRGYDPSRRDTGWQQKWEYDDRTPALVRLDATLRHGDWPMLLAPIRVAARAVNGIGHLSGNAYPDPGGGQ